MKNFLSLLVFSIAMIGSVAASADDMPEGINLKVEASVTVEDGRDLPTLVSCDDMCH